MTKKPSNTKASQAKDTKKTVKRKPGRPTVMTEATQLEICARMGAGENLTQVCRDPAMPGRTTVTNYLLGGGPEHLRFRELYAAAREALLDVYAGQIISISDDGTTDYVMKTGRNGHEYQAVDQEHIQRSRLRVDSRKWLLSKLRPDQYGDKVGTEVSVNVAVAHDISSLSEREKMRRFALFMVEDQRQPAGETVVISEPLKESSNTMTPPTPDPTESKQPGDG
jgi:hypothetical protein